MNFKLFLETSLDSIGRNVLNNINDDHPIMVMSDWLDDHNAPGLANLVRQIVPLVKELTKFSPRTWSKLAATLTKGQHHNEEALFPGAEMIIGKYVYEHIKICLGKMMPTLEQIPDYDDQEIWMRDNLIDVINNMIYDNNKYRLDWKRPADKRFATLLKQRRTQPWGEPLITFITTYSKISNQLSSIFGSLKLMSAI